MRTSRLTDGLHVPPVFLGLMTVGGRGGFEVIGTTDLPELKTLIDAARDRGINGFDTANVYSGGLSEELLGQALGGHRDDVVISTKGGFPVGPGPDDSGASPEHLQAQLEQSLRRLRTDYVDIYYVHVHDGHTSLGDTLIALDDLARAGKIRAFGVSNFAGRHLTAARYIADQLDTEHVACQQVDYSLDLRDAEVDAIPAGIEQDVKTFAYSPLRGGFLTGKYHRGDDAPAADARHLLVDAHPPIQDHDRLAATIACLDKVAEAHDATPAQVAIAWVLTRPGIAGVVLGAKSLDQLEDTARGAELHLPPGHLDELTAASAPRLPWPVAHQAALTPHLLTPAERVLYGLSPA